MSGKKIGKLRIFVLLLVSILVNISCADIPKDALTTNSPSKEINNEAAVATNFDEENVVESTTSEQETTTPSENNGEGADNTQLPNIIIESTTNEIECVCDCIANGNSVSVGCSTQTPDMAQRETTENPFNNESNTPTSEENAANSNHRETSSVLNEDIDTSTPVAGDSQTTTVSAAPICTTPGLQAHELDCHQYYSCSMEGSEDGNLHLITKSCPEKQAFSVELNRCSRDISSCSLDIQCLRKETIPDPANNSYYLCEPRLFGTGFRIFHVNCGANEIFYTELGKCYVDLNNLPAFNWNQPKDIDVVNAELKLLKKQDKLKLKLEKERIKAEEKEAKKKAKEEAKANKVKAKQEVASFLCEKEGNFASQIADSFYISCINKKEKLSAISMRCGIGSTFYPTIGACVYTEKSATSSTSDDGDSDDED